MNWYKDLKSKVLIEEKTSKHTTFKIGGRVPLWIEAFNLDELKFIIKKIEEKKLDFFIMGQGSNVLIPDKRLGKVILRLKSSYFNRIFIKDNYVIARAGSSLNSLINKCHNYSLSGIEFLTGIPGTIGGALYMNAGIKDKCIGDLVEEVKVLNYKAAVMILEKDSLNFRYRDGSFNECIIVEVKLKLKKDNKKDILDRRMKFFEYKKKTQPLNYASAGCIFKNPLNLNQKSAELIERSGLKGHKVGQAQISLKHANFIINKGGAKFEDVCELIRLVQERVKMLYNIKLETEIKIL